MLRVMRGIDQIYVVRPPLLQFAENVRKPADGDFPAALRARNFVIRRTRSRCRPKRRRAALRRGEDNIWLSLCPKRRRSRSARSGRPRSLRDRACNPYRHYIIKRRRKQINCLTKNGTACIIRNANIKSVRGIGPATTQQPAESKVLMPNRWENSKAIYPPGSVCRAGLFFRARDNQNKKRT